MTESEPGEDERRTMAIRRLAKTALAVVLVGCACTDIGCGNQVVVALPFDVQRDTPYEVRMCFDDRCVEEVLAVDGPATRTGAIAGSLTLWEDTDRLDLELGDGDFAGPHRVTLSMLDAAGTTVADFEGDVELARSQPNGAFCDPICWWTQIDL